LIALVVSLFLESLARCSRNHASNSTIRGRLRSWRAQTHLGCKPVDLALDGEQNIDAPDRLGRDRRLAEPREIKELAPAMGPARGLGDRASLAIGLVELAEAGWGN
jgi:hypothetical protein